MTSPPCAATCPAATALRRQQLVRLTPDGWAAALGQAGEGQARSCVDYWARHDLPLVVTRQPLTEVSGLLALGLPAPLRWGRLRLALRAERQHVASQADFPSAATVTGLLPASFRPRWQRLTKELAARGTVTRVYGSFGWQQLTRLDYLHAASDLDLLLEVTDAEHADRVCERLTRADPTTPRLDGELCFADGRAVAWREWAPWRDGRQPELLVKHQCGVTLVADRAGFDDAAIREAVA